MWKDGKGLRVEKWQNHPTQHLRADDQWQRWGGLYYLWKMPTCIRADGVEIRGVLVRLGVFALGSCAFPSTGSASGFRVAFLSSPPILGELECVNTAGISSQALAVCLEN